MVDAEKVKREEQAYKPIPVITDFTETGMAVREVISEATSELAGRVALEYSPDVTLAELMTTVSTMIGSLPVALALSEGGEVRQPMSVAVARRRPLRSTS